VQSPDVLIDFVHVEDAASAFLKAAALLEQRSPEKKGSLSRYCVSSGTEVNPEGLVAMFERIGESKLVLQKDPMSGASRRAKPWRGPALPGWTPQVDLETGIKRMLSIKR
jgi:nucleoside-diphosphate-sugar epimerase